jgi:hypothetical protein
MDLDLDDCEALADFWLFVKDDRAQERIDAYVQRGRRFADEPVEWLRILYKQSEENWALGPTTPLMSADGQDAECELTLRGALARGEELIHANELKRNWINGWIAKEAREEMEPDELEGIDGKGMN